MRKKIAVIGLDGATFDLLRPWTDLGYLPNLRHLIDHGAHGVLKSTVPWVTAPAWASFATGKNPGKHGCYDFAMPTGSLSRYRLVTSRDIPGKTFYELLSEQGIRSTLINLPVSYPPRIEGPVITSLMTTGDDCVFPPSLLESVPELRVYRPMPRSLRLTAFGPHERHRFVCAQKLFHMDWDFFFVLFSASDPVSHQKYAEMCQQPAPRGAGEVFQDLDQYIGWFLNHIQKDTDLLVISDHGFQHFEHVFFLNLWLEQQGYLVSQKDTTFRRVRRTYRANRLELPSPLAKAMQTYPRFSRLLRFLAQRAHPLLPVGFYPPSRGANLKKSAAYLPSTSCQGIYINDKGRFDDGNVAESQVPALREAVIEHLTQLRNPYTGDNVFRTVWRREELYTGDYLAEAPDVLLDPNCGLSHYLPHGDPFQAGVRNWHARDGMVIAYGSDIVSGQTLNGAEIVDIAPTILHMMGLSVPEDIDGKVLTEIFKPDSEIARKPIRLSGGTGTERGRTITEPHEGSDEVMKRLRGLGYL